MQRFLCHSISLHTGVQQDWSEPIHRENASSQHTGRRWVRPDCSQLTWKENIQAPILVPLMVYRLKGIYFCDNFPVLFLQTSYFPSLKQRTWKRLTSLFHVHNPTSEMLFSQIQTSFPDPNFNCPQCKCLSMKLLF